ncbi:hypothetical protein [Prochlorococcus marinus]|uniref:hypothetical protein n=1 Tax=Prochlorococcus marinus TaxID=1219 RepID=UPI0022B3187C|nr:hypothetical protein [Prochlorococcus marinus]
MDCIQASFLISTSKPKELSTFYSSLFSKKVEEGFDSNHCSINAHSSLQITFYKPSSNRIPSDMRCPPISLCFEKPASKEPLIVLNNWLEEVISLGATLIEKPKLESFGAEAWVLDIDQNKVLLYVPYKKSCE